jgi:hypothetical protein
LKNGRHLTGAGRFSFPPIKADYNIRMTKRSCILFSLIALAACVGGREERAQRTAADSARADSIARARQDSINRASPGYVIDSILPVEEELRRFRAAIGGSTVSGLSNGSRSREDLVRRFMTALSRSDSTEMKRMALGAREFADLVYPESPYTHPPYRQSPALVWYQIQNGSRSGLTRILRRLGGQPLRYVDNECERKPEHQGRNMLWTNCTVRVISPAGDTSVHRFFGSIIERDGAFKIVSYKNEF